MRGITQSTTIKAAALALALPLAAHAACAPDKVTVRGDFGTVTFTVEVVDTPQDRAIGLMNRPSMPRFSGMLFVYERPQRLSFWMRNTLIPLDMLFADATGRITHLHENAIPHDDTPIEGGEGTHVLEINGGMSAQLGIKTGDILRHESFSQAQAAWPCAAE